MLKLFLGFIMIFSNNQIFSQTITIISIDSPQQAILRTKTKNIEENELSLAREIEEKLLIALKPYFPAAGLAAPQIGIDRSVFIYSYDRDPQHLELVINPTFVPLGSTYSEGWEGCLSVITSSWKLACVPRYEKIKTFYLNAQGERVEKILEGFAAKVFQHEYDHLQGIVNIDRSDAIIKEFATQAELQTFMQAVKKQDANHYIAPQS